MPAERWNSEINFSILIANKLGTQGKRLIWVDCDVDCPNDYLLLGQKLKKLNVPMEIITSQANLINKIAKETKTAITHQIPYSEKVVNAYSGGNLLGLNLI